MQHHCTACAAPLHSPCSTTAKPVQHYCKASAAELQDPRSNRAVHTLYPLSTYTSRGTLKPSLPKPPSTAGARPLSSASPLPRRPTGHKPAPRRAQKRPPPGTLVLPKGCFRCLQPTKYPPKLIFQKRKTMHIHKKTIFAHISVLYHRKNTLCNIKRLYYEKAQLENGSDCTYLQQLPVQFLHRLIRPAR